MSGAEVPYHLRPNKYVDRQIFIESLIRFGRARSLQNYIYISMAGKFLEDHKAMILALDLQGFRSIDGDEATVMRQNFNKPSESIICEHKTSAEFVQGFSAMASSLADGTNFVVWMDYTQPGKRLEQMQEFEKLITHAIEFDVVRITVNANVTTLGDPPGKLPDGFANVRELRLSRYRSQLGQYAGNVDANDMVQDKFPIAVAKAIGQAAKRGSLATQGLVARPLSVQRYSDGPHTMLATTVVMLKAGDADAFFEQDSLRDWPFRAQDWDDVSLIDVPDLSTKERIHIDRRLSVETDEQIHAELGFKFDDDDLASSRKIAQYRRHFRFYPQFVRVML